VSLHKDATHTRFTGSSISDVSGLQLRGKTYFARKRVTDDLRVILGKRELTKTLERSDKREAKRRLWPILSAWETLFAELQVGTALPQPESRDGHAVTPEAVEHASWRHYSAALDRDQAVRRQRPSKEEVQDARKTMEAETRKLDTTDPIAFLDVAVDCMVKRDHKRFAAETRVTYLGERRKDLYEGKTVGRRRSILSRIDPRTRTASMYKQTGGL
jgi:hypothetical protein